MPQTSKIDQLILTYSSANCYMICARRYYWRYERGMVPKEESRHITIGKLTHSGLAVLLRTSKLAPALKAIKGDSDPAQIARFLIKQYVAHYGIETKKAKVLPERTFKVDLGGGLLICGKIDATIFKGGELWLWEHKTAGQIDQDYLAKLPLDRQVSTYLWATAVEASKGRLGKLGKEPEGVVYNILRKPSTYMRAGEDTQEWLLRCKPTYMASPSSFFVRQRCYRGTTDFDPLLEDLQSVAADIRRDRLSGHWRKSTTQCFAPQRSCDYPALCIHEDPPTLLRYKLVDPFVELGTTKVPVARRRQHR